MMARKKYHVIKYFSRLSYWDSGNFTLGYSPDPRRESHLNDPSVSPSFEPSSGHFNESGYRYENREQRARLVYCSYTYNKPTFLDIIIAVGELPSLREESW